MAARGLDDGTIGTPYINYRKKVILLKSKLRSRSIIGIFGRCCASVYPATYRTMSFNHAMPFIGSLMSGLIIDAWCSANLR